MKTEEAPYESPKDRRNQTLYANVRFLEILSNELEDKKISTKKAIDTLRRIQLNLLKIMD